MRHLGLTRIGVFDPMSLHYRLGLRAGVSLRDRIRQRTRKDAAMVQRRRAKTFSKSLWFQLAVVVAGVFGGYLAGIALVLAIDMFPPGACALMLTR